MAILLIMTNGFFLIAYILFFGAEADLIVCKTLKIRECGHPYEYQTIILAFLLPILFIRRLRNIGFFSIFVLLFTFFALGIIVYINI
jgi:hypothetical protein